ncbi:MAG: ADP-ribosylglycohydrolase family protein [Deltaproteobacteria bacterium]|nr:MAG: ADP-ribosylglycohydrolase family protein [Deltaproteobacteria bacterium]
MLRHNTQTRAAPNFWARQDADMDFRASWHHVPQPTHSLITSQMRNFTTMTTKSTVMDRRKGAWFGLAVGDALGAPFEFRSAAQVASEAPAPLRMQGSSIWLPGEWTDDTALTLATARAYSRRDGTFRLNRAVRAMTRWLASGPKDVGTLTQAALRLIENGTSPKQAGRLVAIGNDRAAGNGSLMRALPTGIVRAASDPQLARESAVLSAITHADPRCIASCIAYNTVVSALLAQPENIRGALTLAKSTVEQAEIQDLIEGALCDLPARYTNGDGIGFVFLALERAFRAVLNSSSFEAGLEDVVRQGGDTDTNAAIAGGLLGARFGFDAIPPHWLTELRDKGVLSSGFRRLVARAAPA